MVPDTNIGFIIGTGRCGTTLLATLLNNHHEICVPPELQLLFEFRNNGSRLLEEYFLRGKNELDADVLWEIVTRCCPHDIQKFLDFETLSSSVSGAFSYKAFVRLLYREIARSQNKLFFLEQTPWYGQRIPLLIDIYPKAKFIHILRDGRDVAISFSRTPWGYPSTNENLNMWADQLKKNRVDARHILSSETYLEVKYEDLVFEQPGTLIKICDFLGCDYEASMLNPFGTDYDAYFRFDPSNYFSPAYNNWKERRERPVFSDSINAWKQHKDSFEYNDKILYWLRYFEYLHH